MRRYLITLLIGLTLPISLHARLLQIIHTNDIHALYETAGNNVGGLAQIKAVIDELRDRSQAAGIDTLVTDSGDFTDGSIYRYSEHGAGPLRLLDAMGYDAAVIGNHDWLVGASQLNLFFEQVNPVTPFIAANFRIKNSHQALRKHFSPYIQVEKAGSRIAVLGLSTNEFVYDWLIATGRMTSPAQAARTWVSKLKKTNDFVFVLSHLGVNKDRKLAGKIRDIDLMIGSHSHTELEAPVFEKNPNGRMVPIVQAGSYGKYVGDLLIDLEPGQPVKVVRDQLLPVRTDGPGDPKIAALLGELRSQLEVQYGPGWLDEVLVESPTPMEPPIEGRTPWGDLYARAMKDASGADLTLDFSMFFGPEQSAGPITREKLFNFYPRTYSTQNTRGWTVWKVKVPGWLLKLVIGSTIELGGFPNTAGLTYKVKQVGKIKLATQFRVNGKRLNPLKNYTVAVSEGVGRGTDEISKFLRSVFLPKDTGIPIWTAVEEKLRESQLPELQRQLRP